MCFRFFPFGQQHQRKSAKSVGKRLSCKTFRRNLPSVRLLVFPILFFLVAQVFISENSSSELVHIAEAILQDINHNTTDTSENDINSIISILDQYDSYSVLSSKDYVSTGTLINAILQASYIIVIAYQEKRSFGIYPYELVEYALQAKIAQILRYLSVGCICCSNLLSLIGRHPDAIVICSINYGIIMDMLYLQHETYNRHKFAQKAHQYYETQLVNYPQQWLMDITDLFNSVYSKESHGNAVDKQEYEFVHEELYKTAELCIKTNCPVYSRVVWINAFQRFVEMTMSDAGNMHLDRLKYYLHQRTKNMLAVAWIDLVFIEILSRTYGKEWKAHTAFSYFSYADMQTDENRQFLTCFKQYVDERIRVLHGESITLNCFMEKKAQSAISSAELDKLVNMVTTMFNIKGESL